MAANRVPSNHLPSASDNRKPHISEKARQRPVRVIPADDRAEMEAGHLTASGNPFSSKQMITRSGGSGSSDDSRGGYGGGYGTVRPTGSSGIEQDADDAPDSTDGASTGFGSFADEPREAEGSGTGSFTAE